MSKNGIHTFVYNKVGDGNTFWKPSFGTRIAEMREVMAVLWIMHRP